MEKEIITGQSWFPKTWDTAKIKKAGRFVIDNNYQFFKELEDGKTIFDNYDGIRIGVIKTNGKIATIFPDNAQQPLINNNEFEFNPFDN